MADLCMPTLTPRNQTTPRAVVTIEPSYPSRDLGILEYVAFSFVAYEGAEISSDHGDDSTAGN